MKLTKVNVLCVQRGITPTQAAKALRIPLKRFSQLSCGHERTPRLRKKIAKFFDKEPQEIWPDYEESIPAVLGSAR